MIEALGDLVLLEQAHDDGAVDPLLVQVDGGVVEAAVHHETGPPLLLPQETGGALRPVLDTKLDKVLVRGPDAVKGRCDDSILPDL